MKKNLLLTLAVALFATSCTLENNNPQWDLPEAYAYATVIRNDATEATEDDSDDTVEAPVYFMLDNNKTFVVTDNNSSAKIEDLEHNQRIIAGVTITDSLTGQYDYEVKLYELVGVSVGENKTVSTEEENEAIADDQLTYVAKDISLTLGYLNLMVGLITDNVDDVEFYLVDNNSDPEAEEDEDYLSLELRFDRASKNTTGSKYEGYLSFDMESYRELLEGKKGIKLRLHTLTSGVAYIPVASKDLFIEE